jgi:predicted phage tail component-like protein
MANSFTYNSIDMADYDLIVTMIDLPFGQANDSLQLSDHAVPFDSYRTPEDIVLNVGISGNDISDLKSNLDNIKKALNQRIDANLILDKYPDRYWNARIKNQMKGYFSGNTWIGTIGFIAHDPVAYSTSETSSDHDIDADPDTIIETTGGNAEIKPVYTLTAGENLGSITLIVQNETTDEALTWDGSLSSSDELEINVATMTVKLNGTESMDGVGISSRFPRLEPDTSNTIIITGFSNTGGLNITYRDRYL